MGKKTALKRIYVAGLHHESNSFSQLVTKEEDFSILRGEEIFENIRDNDSLSGLVLGLREAGYELVPGLAARAIPSGLVDRELYLSLKEEITQVARRAQEEGPLDGICLSLHGSMRIKDYGEAEGPLLEELREIFPQLPIYASLDMHATMTNKMHSSASGFVAYKSAPHIDCTETGLRAARLMKNHLQGRELKSIWVYVPILVAGEKSGTSVSPMKELVQELKKAEARDGVLAASYLMGFPWADSKEAGLGVYLVGYGPEKILEGLAQELAAKIWSRREDFVFVTQAFEPKKALDEAFESVARGQYPVYISDSGDNPTAGGSSDQAGFLELILSDRRIRKLARPLIYGGIYDPEALGACRGKLNNRVRLFLGGCFDKSSPRLEVEGRVKAYYKDWAYKNFPKGDIAVLALEGLDLVLTDQHIGYTDPQLFRDLGLEPEKAQIIVTKLGYLTPGHEKIAKRSILALTQGATNQDLSSLDYRLIRRPIFPLDKDFDYGPELEARDGS